MEAVNESNAFNQFAVTNTDGDVKMLTYNNVPAVESQPERMAIENAPVQTREITTYAPVNNVFIQQPEFRQREI